jgi:hypothetical protein
VGLPAPIHQLRKRLVPPPRAQRPILRPRNPNLSLKAHSLNQIQQSKRLAQSSSSISTKRRALGPEFIALVSNLKGVNPNSQDGQVLPPILQPSDAAPQLSSRAPITRDLHEDHFGRRQNAETTGDQFERSYERQSASIERDGDRQRKSIRPADPLESMPKQNSALRLQLSFWFAQRSL